MRRPAHVFCTPRSHRLLLGLIVLASLTASGCGILPGHWRPGWNQQHPPDASMPDTAGSWTVTDAERRDQRFIGLAISGGGSRAANFGAAAMLELQRRGLLEQVDVISGVSGGTLPAVYYGLGDKAGPFTEEAVSEVMGFDFQGNWLWRWLWPHNVFRYWLTDFTRSDIMVQVFNKHLTHKALYRDLGPHPKILLNATVHNDHTRFTFTDDRFAALRSVLATYPVANAVNASSAFPGVFDDVTLENYHDPTQYVHLYDGGPIENLGVQAVLEYLNRSLVQEPLPALFPKGCVVFVIDATPASERPELNSRQSSRRAIDFLINTNALDSMDAMLLESRRSVLSRLGIPVTEQDRATRGRVSVAGAVECQCEVRHIALRHLSYVADTPQDPDFARRVARINTKFWVSKEEQQDLFAAARLIMQELDDQGLLSEASFKPRCEES